MRLRKYVPLCQELPAGDWYDTERVSARKVAGWDSILGRPKDRKTVQTFAILAKQIPHATLCYGHGLSAPLEQTTRYSANSGQSSLTPYVWSFLLVGDFDDSDRPRCR